MEAPGTGTDSISVQRPGYKICQVQFIHNKCDCPGYSTMSSLTTKVDKSFVQWDRSDSPGCALAIIQNGEIIYKRGYGMANLEYDIPISPNSVFDIGSNSKQFTAMCIVILVRQNLLTLDDELQNYIPEIPQYSHPITIRNLIYHTSGLRDYPVLMKFAGIIYENHYPEEEIIDLIARQQSLNFQPGTEQLYCNSGYFLLAQIVKRISGKSLRVFAEEHIFAPLGMKNTHFHDSFREVVRNRADGYAPKDEGGFQLDMSLLDNTGAGSVYTTIEDLLFWDQNFYHNILSGCGQDLIEEITTSVKLNNDEATTDVFGFGLRIGKYKGLNMINHGGVWLGYRSDLVRFPDCKFSVICLANLSTFNPTKLALQVAELYLENELTEVVAKPVPRSIQSINLSLEELEIRTGYYHDPMTGSVGELEVKDGKLMAKLGLMYFQLVPIDSNHFQSVDNEIEYDIEFPEDRTQMVVTTDSVTGVKIYTLEKMLTLVINRLIDYLGTYYSPELEFSYKMYLEDNKLFFKCKGYAPFHLRSIGQDLFLLVADKKFEFVRDEQGQVTGVDRCSNRVRRIHFSKQ
jgi:CubicO group peptidase (beta-lactamase class C family)